MVTLRSWTELLHFLADSSGHAQAVLSRVTPSPLLSFGIEPRTVLPDRWTARSCPGVDVPPNQKARRPGRSGGASRRCARRDAALRLVRSHVHSATVSLYHSHEYAFVFLSYHVEPWCNDRGSFHSFGTGLDRPPPRGVRTWIRVRAGDCAASKRGSVRVDSQSRGAGNDHRAGVSGAGRPRGRRVVGDRGFESAEEVPLSVLWKRGATIMPRETFDAMPASTGRRRNSG